MDGHAWHLLPCGRDEDLLCARRPALLKTRNEQQKQEMFTQVLDLFLLF